MINYISVIISIPGNRSTRQYDEVSLSSGSSRILVSRIKTIMEKLKSNQTRELTKKNFLGIWRHFNNFIICLDHQQSSWEDNLVLFGTHLVDLGSQSSTIKSYFSAIKHILHTDGYEWDDNKAMLTTITKSCKLMNDRVFVRLPISKNLLELMIIEINRILDKQPYLKCMYNFYACLLWTDENW